MTPKGVLGSVRWGFVRIVGYLEATFSCRLNTMPNDDLEKVGDGYAVTQELVASGAASDGTQTREPTIAPTSIKTPRVAAA
jgi:hypothetical protein